jgi:hypothetical protein
LPGLEPRKSIVNSLTGPNVVKRPSLHPEVGEVIHTAIQEENDTGCDDMNDFIELPTIPTIGKKKSKLRLPSIDQEFGSRLSHSIQNEISKKKVLETIEKLEKRFGNSSARARVSRYSSLSRFAGLCNATIRLATLGSIEFVMYVHNASPSLARIMLDSTNTTQLLPASTIWIRYVQARPDQKYYETLKLFAITSLELL